MSWNRKDDNFYDSPDVVAYGLELEELAIYDLAVTYCCRHLTDGKVPVRVLIAYASRRFIEVPEEVMAKRWQCVHALLDFGFFTNLSDGSIEVANYLRDHDSRAQVEEKRKRISDIRAEAGRAGGLAKASVASAKQNLAPGAKQSLSPGGNQVLAPGAKQILAPHRSSPHHTDPGCVALKATHPMDLADTTTHARTSGAAPAPDSPAAHPVRMINQQKTAEIELDAPVTTDQMLRDVANLHRIFDDHERKPSRELGGFEDTLEKTRIARQKLSESGLNDDVKRTRKPGVSMLEQRKVWASQGLNPDTGEPFVAGEPGVGGAAE